MPKLEACQGMRDSLNNADLDKYHKLWYNLKGIKKALLLEVQLKLKDLIDR